MKEFAMQYWLEFIFGLVITGLSFCYNRLAKKFKDQETIKEGIIAILHDRLFHLGMSYIEKEEITLSDLENFEGIYNAYHSLGGNGTGTEIYERVKELPLIK